MDIAHLFKTVYIVPSLIIIISVLTDLYRRKVYNKFIIAALVVSIINHFVFLSGFSSLKMGLLTAFLAFCIMVPLYSIKMLGGGDLKVFVVLALNITIPALINTFIFSLVWGLILGLFMVLLKKKSKVFISNTLDFIKFKKPDHDKLTTVPYTVAILLGWVTHLSLRGFNFI